MSEMTQDKDRGYEERRCRIADGDTTVVRDSNPNGEGKAVPIVLIHALGLDRRMWDDVFDRLVASGGVRVISYDLRGHGEAANTNTNTNGQAQAPVKDLEHLADDLRVLLDDCNIHKADIYGQSYGGAVAQYFALKYPQRTRSLGLITTAGKSQPSWVTRATRAEDAGSVAEPSLMDETLRRWFSAEAIRDDHPGVRYARDCLQRISVKNWAGAWRSMSGLDTLDRLKRQGGFGKVPVLLVCGVQDASTGPEHMGRLRDACENRDEAVVGAVQVQYKELDPGVHMMALEQGEALTREILEFRRLVDGKYK
jgi:3-oxoadipate enol-lactonase